MAGRGAGNLWRRPARLGLMAAVVVGCGGASPPPRAFTVSLPLAAFPARQHIGAPIAMRIDVRNDGRQTLPDTAVSVYSFSAPGPTGPRHPAWILDRAPGGAGAAQATWTLGPLAPRATLSFVWRVTPVRPGRYTVAYRVDAGPAQGAVAALAGGRPAAGTFAVTIVGSPSDSRVDPATGTVIRRF